MDARGGAGRPRAGARRSGTALVANLRGGRRRGRDRSSRSPTVPDLVFTANAGIVNGDAVRAQPLPPSRTPARDARSSPRGSPRTGFAGRPAARRRSATKAPATRCRSAACSCRATGSAPTLPAATELSRLHRRAGAAGRAGRRAALPPRPHVLSARRPPRDRARRWAGTATAARSIEALVPEPLWLDGRRGADVLRQLGRGRHARS